MNPIGKNVDIFKVDHGLSHNNDFNQVCFILPKFELHNRVKVLDHKKILENTIILIRLQKVPFTSKNSRKVNKILK